MELSDYWEIISRRRRVIVTTLVFTLAATVLGTLLLTPRYEASATLRVATATTGSVDFFSYDIDYADRLMNTYLNLATTQPVLQELSKKLEFTEPLQDVASWFELEIPANTELIQIVTAHPDPEQAAAIANTLADILIEESESSRLEGDRPFDYQVTVVEPAIISETPSSPNRVLNGALGLLAGLIGGLGLAFLFENLDTTLHTVEQIAGATQLAVLAHVPKAEQSQRPASNGSSPYEEAFRRLRASILAYTKGAPLKTLLFTSDSSESSTSTVVANLALAAARAEQRVVVVDANFEYPMVHTLFGLPNEYGLSDLLHGEEALPRALQASPYQNVTVLASGQRTKQIEPLSSARMAQLLAELKEQFCWVLLLTPTLLKAADALELVPQVDGIILVVERQRAQRGTVQTACRYLDSVKAQTLGVVVTE